MATVAGSAKFFLAESDAEYPTISASTETVSAVATTYSIFNCFLRVYPSLLYEILHGKGVKFPAKLLTIATRTGKITLCVTMGELCPEQFRVANSIVLPTDGGTK